MVEFVKSNAAFSSSKVSHQIITSYKGALSMSTCSTMSGLGLIVLVLPQWGNVTFAFPCLEVWKTPALVIQDLGYTWHFTRDVGCTQALVNIKYQTEVLSNETLHNLIADLPCLILSPALLSLSLKIGLSTTALNIILLQ